MNYLDVIIAVPLIWGAYKGFQRGLIFEVAMIIGLLLGFYIAFKSSTLFEGLIRKIFGDGSFIPYFTFFIVVVTIILIMVLLAKFFEGILKITNLNLFNKISGAVFGLLKSALILSILLAVFRPLDSKFEIIKPKVIHQSVLYTPIVKFSKYIFPTLMDIQKVFKERL